MANKYIRHGETYCGDGTTSAAAASDGAVGAWNDINVMEGTAPAYGALAAGDVVYIRSLDAAGAAITRTLTAARLLGSTAATATNPITWILDDGTVWSGINGVLTFTNSASYMTTLRINNVFVSKTRHNWKIKYTSTNPNGVLADIYGHCDGFEFDTSAKTGDYSLNYRLHPGAIVENAHFLAGRLSSVPNDAGGLIRFSDYAYGVTATLINPEIELTSTTLSGSVFTGGYTTSGIIKVFGGRIYGAGAITGQAVFSYRGSGDPVSTVYDTVGFQIPRSMDIFNVSVSRNAGSEARIVAADSEMGGYLDTAWGFATSRTDNNPPYLAGALPDSLNTVWSSRVYPRAATEAQPMALTAMKLFTGTAATKTISQEVLVANTMSPNKRNLWISVTYTDDATGLQKSLTTRDHAAGTLDASTANWSATVWGMVTFVKRKLSVTTPTAIKQNTPIVVTLFGTLTSETANDIYFVDSDFGVN